jgi:hypothetical protein
MWSPLSFYRVFYDLDEREAGKIEIAGIQDIVGR